MEAFPLLECLLGLGVVLFVVPVQHAGRVFNTDALAELLEDCRWIVQEIISVDDTDVCNSTLLLAVLACKLGTDLATRTEVVEQAALLVVSSLRRHEVVEAGYGVERRNSASPVAGNAVLGVTDEEGEMELVQDFGRHDGGISRFGFCGIGIGRRVLHGNVGLGALGTIGNVRQRVAAISANTTLDLHQ